MQSKMVQDGSRTWHTEKCNGEIQWLTFQQALLLLDNLKGPSTWFSKCRIQMLGSTTSRLSLKNCSDISAAPQAFEAKKIQGPAKGILGKTAPALFYLL